MVETDKTLQVLTLLAGLKAPGGPEGAGSGEGVQLAEIKTTEPDDITLVLTGTDLALDLDLFEVPVTLYPLCVGDRLLALPFGDSDSGRWSLVAKLNNGQVMATMQSSTSLKPDGMAMVYGAERLILPAAVLAGIGIRALQSGDRVSIAPTLVGDVIKYVVLNKY